MLEAENLEAEEAIEKLGESAKVRTHFSLSLRRTHQFEKG